MTRKSIDQQRTNRRVTVSVPEVKAMLSEQTDFLMPAVAEAVQANFRNTL